MRLEPLHPVVGVDGRDHTRLGLALLGHILVQNILQIVGGGGFALGARDAHHLHVLGGVVVKQVGQGGDGPAHIGHLDTGQVHLGIGRLADVGQGALLLGGGQKFRLEMGPLAQKQRAGDHLPGVVGHQGHRRLPCQLRQRPGQQVPLPEQGQVIAESMSHSSSPQKIQSQNRSPEEKPSPGADSPYQGEISRSDKRGREGAPAGGG